MSVIALCPGISLRKVLISITVGEAGAEGASGWEHGVSVNARAKEMGGSKPKRAPLVESLKPVKMNCERDTVQTCQPAKVPGGGDGSLRRGAVTEEELRIMCVCVRCCSGL